MSQFVDDTYCVCTTIFKNIFVSHDMYKLKIKG